MSRIVSVAATQMACSWDRAANIANAEKLVRQAAAKGAQIILIQELFETPYFCQKPNAARTSHSEKCIVATCATFAWAICPKNRPCLTRSSTGVCLTRRPALA